MYFIIFQLSFSNIDVMIVDLFMCKIIQLCRYYKTNVIYTIYYVKRRHKGDSQSLIHISKYYWDYLFYSDNDGKYRSSSMRSWHKKLSFILPVKMRIFENEVT